MKRLVCGLRSPPAPPGWQPRSTSEFSSSGKARASTVCTTKTPCSTPRSMSGTPRKRLVGILTGLFEILESRMLFHLLNCDGRTCSATRPASPSWMPIRRVLTFAAESERRGQHEVSAVWFEQVSEQTSYQIARRSRRPRSSRSRPACRLLPRGWRFRPASAHSWHRGKLKSCSGLPTAS